MNPLTDIDFDHFTDSGIDNVLNDMYGGNQVIRPDHSTDVQKLDRHGYTNDDVFDDDWFEGI